MITANWNMIERYFWHKAIPLLSSGNRTVSTLVRIGGRIYPMVKKVGLPLKALFWATIGLSRDAWRVARR